jgi:hypothetical protein
VTAVDLERGAQQLAEIADRAIDRRSVALARQHRERVERVEQEVRADLRLQALERAAVRLCSQARRGDRAIRGLAARVEQPHHDHDRAVHAGLHQDVEDVACSSPCHGMIAPPTSTWNEISSVIWIATNTAAPPA